MNEPGWSQNQGSSSFPGFNWVIKAGLIVSRLAQEENRPQGTLEKAAFSSEGLEGKR